MKNSFLAGSRKILIRLFSLILSTCVLLAVFPMAFTSAADPVIWDGSYTTPSGNGNWDNPYIISNASELAYISNILSSGNGTAWSGKTFKLTADIYLNDVSNYDNWSTVAPANVWNSAGKYASWQTYRDFGGIFDGNGHTIYGLYVSGNANTGTGLFGAVNNATIKNLNIDKAYVSGTTVIGGIVGIARGNTTIEKCSFSGKINASSNFAGGLVGKYEITNNTNLNINSSFTEGEFTASGVIIGGFIGEFVSNTTSTVGISINNSYSAANISGNDYRAAGFIGRATNGSSETGKSVSIRRSHFSGTLSSKATGTLVGMDASHITTVADTYYNETIIGGAATKALVYGTAKSSTEFSDGTVLELLSSAEANSTTDLWDWAQGDDYPIPDRQVGSRLENLILSEGEIDFKPTTTEYAFDVPSYVKTITVTPTAKTGSSITVNGVAVVSGADSDPVGLANGVTSIYIVVTGGDSSTTTYTLTVTRPASELEVDVWDGTYTTPSGNGNWDNPYIISNASELAYISNILSTGNGTAFSGKTFKLTADIYLNDISDYDSWGGTAGSKNVWNSAGKYAAWNSYRDFGGTFDGNGHTIYGLYVSGNVNTGTGLFGAVNNATIKNLNVDKAYVSGTTNVGGIVGIARGDTTVENCGFSGKVNANSAYTGGFIGKYVNTSDSKSLYINSCHCEGEVVSTGPIVGGFIGLFDSTNIQAIYINNSYCAANISGSDYRTAGFIGRATDTGSESGKSVTIRRSHFSGTLSSNATGTLVGRDVCSVTTATDTYYNATVIGGAANKTLVYGTAKTNEEFTNGTVTSILNMTEKQEETDLWNFINGKRYPESPKNIVVNGNVTGGNISLDKKTGEENDVVKVTIRPGEGKILKAGSLAYVFNGIKFPIYARYDSWVYTGNIKPDDTTGIYSDTGVYYFNLPSSNVEIIAEFIDENAKNISLIRGYAVDNSLRFISRVYNTSQIDDTVYSLSRKYGTVLIRADHCGELNFNDAAAIEAWLADAENKNYYKTVRATRLTDKTENYCDFSVSISGIDDAAEKSVEYVAIAFAKYGDASNAAVTVYSNPCTESYNSAKAKENIHNATASDIIKMSGTVTATRGYKWVAAENKAVQIMKTEDDLDLTEKTVYYVSPNGNDSNNGTAENSAWRSAEKVAEFLNDRVANNDTTSIAILFERGSIYRQTGIFNINSNVTIGAYGSGSKPAIYGSRQNYADVSLWNQTAKNNVWEMDIDTDDIGIIVLGNNDAVCVKKNYYNDLKKNGDFYHDRDDGKIYLYFTNGNPGSIYDNIEIGSRGNLLFIGENAQNVTIDNLTVKYGGSHAIATRRNVSDITITNCEIAWIGGSYQADDNFTRYGNGVQFWDSSENCYVSNNWIYQIYDTGITFQGAIDAYDSPNNYENIWFNDNLIEYCTYSVEFFDRVATSTATDIYIMDNIMRFAGYGWGKQRTDASATSHICAWHTSGAFIKENFQITGNTFEYTTGNFVYWNWANEKSYDGVFVSGNSFYKPATQLGFAMCYGYDDVEGGTVQIKAYNQEQLEEAVALFDESPAEVVWVRN